MLRNGVQPYPYPTLDVLDDQLLEHRISGLIEQPASVLAGQSGVTPDEDVFSGRCSIRRLTMAAFSCLKVFCLVRRVISFPLKPSKIISGR